MDDGSVVAFPGRMRQGVGGQPPDHGETHMMKTASIAASLLLVGFGASACGGGADSAPKDASVEEFCTALEGFGDTTDTTKVTDVADKLKDVGTPAGIPDEARKGFEFIIDNASKIDDLGDKISDQQAFEDAFSADAATQLLALFTYYGTTCSNLPSGNPTE
jgi:hypothetical protein